MVELQLPVIIEKDADGHFAFCPQLQGCYSQGDTHEEALANARAATQLRLEDAGITAEESQKFLRD